VPLDPTTRAAAPPSVSSDDEPLILVDTEDRPTGSASKRVCHDGDGLLHRAFSIFLFRDDGRVLLQQRSALKRLWPLYWSNACCSHPRLGEETPDAAQRRLRQELGLAAELHYVYKFRYQARYDASGSEHELCWVFVGRVSAEPRIHPDEIGDCREYTAEDLDAAVSRSPETFTPWFLMEWRALRGEYRERVRQLLALPTAVPAPLSPVSTSVP
jgi:isopentenyl-diphosphate delta-isomerase